MVVMEPMVDGHGHTANGTNMLEYPMEGQEQGYLLDGTEQSMSAWKGGLADALGLTDQPVDAAVLRFHAAGFVGDGFSDCKSAGILVDRPKLDKDGNPVLNKNGEPVIEKCHRAGHALVFSHDKSVSLAYAASDDRTRADILAATDAGVDAGMDLIRRYTESRQGKGGEAKIATDGLLYAKFQHWSARAGESGEYMPLMHKHVALMNMALAGGDVQSLNDGQLYSRNLVYAADMVSKAVTASRLAELGFKFEKVIEHDKDGRETGQIDYRLVGISEKAVALTSERRQEALALVEKHGGSLGEALKMARKSKDTEPSYSELTAPGGVWDTLIGKLVAAGHMVGGTALKNQPDHIGLGARDDATIIANLHNKNGVAFSRVTLLGELAKEMGPLFPTTAEAQERVVDAFMTRNDLHRFECEPRAGLATYSSHWYVEQESALIRSAGDRANDPAMALTADVSAAIAAFEAKKSAEVSAKEGKPIAITMSDEQKNVVRTIAAGSGTMAIEGRAGTGKTFSIGCATDMMKAEGWTVYGLAQGNAAAYMLEAESGASGSSIASFLSRVEQGTIDLSNGKFCILVDEAGMIDVPTGRKLQALCDANGGRLVFMGDRDQIQGMGAGSAMAAAINGGAPLASLNDINRQRGGSVVRDADGNAVLQTTGQHAGKELRQGKAISNLLYARKGEAAIDALRSEGMIEEVKGGRKWEIEAIARAYVEGRGPLGEDGKNTKIEVPLHERIALAVDNRTADAIQRDIRLFRRERGELIGPDHSFKSVNHRGQDTSLTLAVGDLIRFNKKAMKVGKNAKDHPYQHTAENKAKFDRRMDYHARTIGDAMRAGLDAKAIDALKRERDDEIKKYHTATMGVLNGTKAIVRDMKQEPNGSMTIIAELFTDLPQDKDPSQPGGRRIVTFNTEHYDRLQLAYCGSNFAAQGQSKQVAYVFAAGLNESHGIVPALTRHKDFMTIVGSKDDITTLTEGISRTLDKGLYETMAKDRATITEGGRSRRAEADATVVAQRREVAASAEATFGTFNVPVRAEAHDQRRDVVHAMAAEHVRRIEQHRDGVTALANPGDSRVMNDTIRQALRDAGRLSGDDVAFPVSHGRAEPPSFKDDIQNTKPLTGPDNRYFRGTFIGIEERPVDPADPDGATSPCAVIRSRSGREYTVMGVDVPDAIARGGVEPGQTIELKKVDDVMVDVLNRKTGQVEKHPRATWSATPHTFAEVALTTKASTLEVAVGDRLSFNDPRNAMATYGLADPAGVRLDVRSLHGGDDAHIRAVVVGATPEHPDHGRELVLKPGVGIDHAHAVPLFRAEAMAHGKEVQVLVSETGKTDIDALRKVQAVSDGVTVHGTGKAFETTAESVKATISERVDLAQKAAGAVRSLGLSHERVSVEHAERTPDAMKALGKAYVDSPVSPEQKIVAAAGVTGVHQANRAVRDALREAQLIDATDVNVPVPRSPTDPVTGKTPTLPVAGGDRLRLRAAAGAKALNLTEPLHDPAAARFEVKSIARTPEGGATVQLRVESTNPKDNDRWITADAPALARMTHAYAGTFSQVAAEQRLEVFALLTAKDSPEKVRDVLAAGQQATLVGKTADVQGFTGKIEAAQRQTAAVLEKAGRAQERDGLQRGAVQDQAQARAVEQAQAQTQMQQERQAATWQREAEAAKATVEKIIADYRTVPERRKQTREEQTASPIKTHRRMRRDGVSI
ncbi:MobF family relaxase [Paraburkholderia tropica]|uniref:MobF family relaxase n=1 Tax=Paraburkholderia tropica TaxID=92647 RepID=UPI001F2A684E|nr:MobF family relaxase [Paraburkholderia tropica]